MARDIERTSWLWTDDPRELERTTQEIGREAESLAADWYLQRGFLVKDQNVRTRRGEVDLVLEKGELVVFAEVRYRSSTAFGSPFDTVDRKKRRKVIMAALDYAKASRARDRSFRFDIVSITPSREGPPCVEVFEGAFDADLGEGIVLCV